MAQATGYAILASDERSSAFADVSLVDDEEPSLRPQRHHSALATQGNKDVAIMDHRQSHRRGKRFDLSKLTAQRAHCKKHTTPSAIIRRLGRLVAKLQKDPEHRPLRRLDGIDNLTRQLRKCIAKGKQKALTTAFSGKPPLATMQ
jgi:hypothetical protein